MAQEKVREFIISLEDFWGEYVDNSSYSFVDKQVSDLSIQCKALVVEQPQHLGSYSLYSL